MCRLWLPDRLNLIEKEKPIDFGYHVDPVYRKINRLWLPGYRRLPEKKISFGFQVNPALQKQISLGSQLDPANQGKKQSICLPS